MTDAGVDAGEQPDAAVRDSPPRVAELYLIIMQGTPSSSMTVRSHTGTGACRLERVAGCDLDVCPSESSPVNLGTVTASGDAGMLTSVPNGTGSYPTATGQVWTTGTVSFTTTGKDLPALEMKVGVPPTVTSAAPPPAVVPRTSPLILPFKATGEGNVAAGLIVRGSATNTTVRCTISAAVTQAVIPSEALAKLPAGSASVFLFGESRKTMVIDTKEVRTAVRGNVELQPISLD